MRMSSGLIAGLSVIVIACILVVVSALSAAQGPGGGGGGGGGGKGGGGGGGEEPVGNNLSFPAIWADGATLAVPGTEGVASVAVPWDANADGVADNVAPVGDPPLYAYAQKTIGNVWQAQNDPAVGTVYVDEVDWGDSLESIDMKVGRPVRIELSLYKTGVSMLGFDMVLLANASSPDEVQGVVSSQIGSAGAPLGAASLKPGPGVPYTEATVFSPNGKVVVQPLVGTRDEVAAGDLVWTGTYWADGNTLDPTDIGAPETLTFAGELNVAGKVIFGLSKGGWRPKKAGDYRITFYLPTISQAQLLNATIRQPEEEIILAEEGDAGGIAVVDGANNLTYIDIRVTASGGGGGGGGKK
jgi:hypothetical protein